MSVVIKDTSLYDATLETVSDLHDWYIRVCLEDREPKDGGFDFIAHMNEEELKSADPDNCFDCIAVRTELNEAGEIRYMIYERIPWIL